MNFSTSKIINSNTKLVGVLFVGIKVPFKPKVKPVVIPQINTQLMDQTAAIGKNSGHKITSTVLWRCHKMR